MSTLWSIVVVAALLVATNLAEPVHKSAAVVAHRIRQFPCTCQGMSCLCCVEIDANLPGKICFKTNFSNFNGLGAQVTLLNENGKPVISKLFSTSGKDLPPICIPVIGGAVELCLQAYDIFFAGDTAQICFKISPQILGAELTNIDFQCLRLQNGGITLGPSTSSNAAALPYYV